jgi:hypothetical protein
VPFSARAGSFNYLFSSSNNMQALGKPFVKAAMTYIAVTSTTDVWVHIIFYTQYAVAAPPEPNFNFHTHTPFLYSYSIFCFKEIVRLRLEMSFYLGLS